MSELAGRNETGNMRPLHEHTMLHAYTPANVHKYYECNFGCVSVRARVCAF